MSDVFISHSSKDAAIANKLCEVLESNGVSCWLAPRNIMPGDDWASAIAKAITVTKVFIIIYSANSAASTQVPKEIMLAGSKSSYIIPYKIDDTPLKENFEYHLGASHWISADLEHNNFKETELLAAVNAGLGRASCNVVVNNITNVSGNVNNYQTAAQPQTSVQKKSKTPLIIGIAAALIVAIIAAVAIMVTGQGDDEDYDDRDRDDEVISGTEDEEAEDTDETEENDDESAEASDSASGDIIRAPMDYTFYDWYDEEITVYNGGNEEFTVMGIAKNEGYVLDEHGSYMMFNVSDFAKVSFTAGVVDTEETGEAALMIYVDGNEYETVVLSAANGPVNVDIDVSDAAMIMIGHDGYSRSPLPVLFDFELVKKETVEEAPAEEADPNVVIVPDEYGIYDWYDEEVGVYAGRNDAFTIMGNNYNSGYVLDQFGTNIMFNVSDFSQVTFTAGALDSGWANDTDLYIYLDNQEYDVIPVKGKGLPEDVTVDVSGATIMRIGHDGYGSAPTVGLYNMKFTKSTEAPEEEAPREVPEGCELVRVPDEYTSYAYKDEKGEVYNGKQDSFTVIGNSYNSGYLFDQFGTFRLFNVKDFTEISFSLGVEDSGWSNDSDVYIYLDNAEYEVVSLKGNGLPEKITIDVTDASILKIGHEGYGSAPTVAMYEIELVKPEVSPVPDKVIETEGYTFAPADVTYTLVEDEEVVVYNGKNDKFSVMGESYNNGYILDQYGSYMTFDVSRYNEALFTIGALDTGSDRESEIKIYLDDVEYDFVNMSTDRIPEDIVVDVSNASTLKIGHDGYAGAPEIAVYNFRFGDGTQQAPADDSQPAESEAAQGE